MLIQIKGLVATGCNWSYCVAVSHGLVLIGLGPVFLEIGLMQDQLQSQLCPKKEKDWTRLDFQTLVPRIASPVILLTRLLSLCI